MIKNGFPIIYQGVLHDPETKTYGSPDLIIRSDYIPKLISGDVTIDIPETENPSESSNVRYIYKIIDIKFNTLKLRADGKHLLNVGRTKCNKGQIIIYNNILSKIQEYKNQYCYILGRGYQYTKSGISYKDNSCFSMLGHIDTFKIDFPYHEQIKKALEWNIDVKLNCNSWDITNPPRKELYPNMCNSYDMPYHNIKKQVADNLKEITLLWNVGTENRDHAHKNNIYRYDDPKLTANILKVNGKRNKTVQYMIDLLHSDKLMNKSKENPIKNDYMLWKRKVPLEFYIDFETINNIVDDFSKLPEIGCQIFVFMIGLYSVKIDPISGSTTNTSYTFVAKDMKTTSEEQIFLDLYKTIEDECKDANVSTNDINFYHWAPAEPSIFNHILNRHSSIANQDFSINFCDVCNIFREEPILFKGIFNFSLKNIAKFLIEHSFIDKEYDYSDVSCGLEAMILAYNYYKGIENSSVINNIIEYNKIDCIIIYKIIEFLRTMT